MHVFSPQEKIFITGATGFIGSHLIPALLHAGAQLICLIHPSEQNRVPTYLRHDSIDLVVGDITDTVETLADLMSGCTHLVHLAGLYSFFAPRESYIAVNVIGTRHIMMAAKRCNLRVVHVSTCAVFGRQRNRFDESTPYGKPMSLYAHTKRLGDEDVRRLRDEEGLHVTILYPAIVLGARDRQASAQYLDGIAEKPWLQGGKGIPMLPFRRREMTWVHVADVVDALIQALTKQEVIGREYLVGGTILPFEAINNTVANLWRRLPKHPRLYFPFPHILLVLSLLASPVFRMRRISPPWGFSPDQIRTMLAEVKFDGSRAERELLGRPYTLIEQAIQDFLSS